jgi:alkylation response protein AidB-like acyl-CoA dehydrogenase
MDFAYSEDQLELRATARSALAALVPAARLGELADSPEGWDPASWRRLGQLGWLGLAGDPEATFVDESVLLEEAGYALLPGPFWSTLALSAPALLAGGGAAAGVFDAVAAGAAAATLAWVDPGGPRALLGVLGADLATVAVPVGDGWVVTGEKQLVPDGAAVSHIVVVAGTAQGPGLFLVERERVGVREVSTTDRTRR